MKTAIVLLSLAFALTGINDDQYHLARAIQGEGPHLVCESTQCRDETGERIGQVALNRLQAGWCSDIQSCVDGGFWGASTVSFPDQWALDAAQRVIDRKETTNTFYVFSARDCHKLDLHPDDAIHVQQRDEWVLAFYGRHTQF